MGTRYIKQAGFGYVPTLDGLVCSLCADYFRREDALQERTASKRVDMEYRYLNFLMYEATAEIVGDRVANAFIDEIGRHIGYASSSVPFSENLYKVRKQEVKIAIARKLHLLD